MARQRLTEKGIATRKPPASGQLDLFDELVSGFGLRIGHGGTKSFFLMTRINGRQRRLTLGRYPGLCLADARTRARAILEDASIGIDPAEKLRREQRAVELRRQNTFGAVAEGFMRDCTASQPTSTEYQRKIDRDLMPAWSDLPIDQITQSDV